MTLTRRRFTALSASTALGVAVWVKTSEAHDNVGDRDTATTVQHLREEHGGEGMEITEGEDEACRKKSGGLFKQQLFKKQKGTDTIYYNYIGGREPCPDYTKP